MNANEFAAILHAKRIGRGKWSALCPVHEHDGRKHSRSLSIGEGSKTPIVFRCMSLGCSQESILAAMNLSWKDILGEREFTRELRGRYIDSVQLEKMEENRALFALLSGIDKKKRKYWMAADRNIRMKIGALRAKINSDEAGLQVRRAMVYRTIKKHGWDAVWAKYLSTERGIAADAQYGVNCE